jgi:hypothetical protein
MALALRIALALVALGASPSVARSDASESEPAKTEAALVVWASPLVTTIERPAYIFHYGYRPYMPLPRSGPVQFDHPLLRKYLASRATRFYNPDTPTRPFMLAGGLYASLDPVIARTFGGIGDEWVLVRIELPPGLRYLDLRRGAPTAEPPLELSPALGEALRQAGCTPSSVQSLFIGVDSASCRAVALAALRDLQVQAILYDYVTSDLPGCPRGRRGGFILLDTEALGSLAAFVSDPGRSDAATPERRMIHTLFDWVLHNGGAHAPPWPTLHDAPGSAVRSWTRRHLFGCAAEPGDG